LEDGVVFNSNCSNIKDESELIKISPNAIAHHKIGSEIESTNKDYEIIFKTEDNSGIGFTYNKNNTQENLALISSGETKILTQTFSVAKNLIYGNIEGQLNYQQVDGGYDLFVS
jgi:hypothetical protein